MPIPRDEQLQAMFPSALAQLIAQRGLLDWKLLTAVLTDTSELETKAAEQAAEIEIATKLIEQAINANVHQSQNQDDYQERFTQFKTRQREAINAYEKTQAQIVRRNGIKAKLTRFKKTIQNATLSQDFDLATLRALCQRIQITPTGEASVIFADGTEIEIPADSY